MQTLSVVQSFVHECSRTAIQDTLKPWCLGSYADLSYSSYSDAASLRLVYTVASSTHIVHPVITKRTATVSGCMHAYQTRLMHNVSRSYFDAASLLTVALLAASFLYLLACLGAWTSRRGLAWRAWSGLPSSCSCS